MKEKVKEEVVAIYKKLEDAGFEVYLVGGCVRNLLSDKEVKDWDLTTNATPEQIQEIFPDSFYDNKFGTVGVSYPLKEEEAEGKNYVEITTFRREGNYKDLRHPESVEWGKSLEEDLSRRDFTINAIALKLKIDDEDPSSSKHLLRSDKKIQETEIIDPFDGQKDLKEKLVRAVGDPDQRFKEDALRLMRAIRFASQMNFDIEEKTLSAIKENAELISQIAFERIRDELFKIFESEHYFEGIELLDKVGILDIIIPELLEGKGISQVRPGRHHKEDIFTHNLLSLKFCPSNDPIVKLAALIHDVGKANVAKTDEEGFIIFHNHEVVGAKVARVISDRLKLSKKQREKIITLIRWHMFTVDEKITDAAVRRFIRRVGLENVKDMIDLRIGDRLGGGTQVAESWRLKKFKERLEEQLHPPFSINDLAVDGNDVMKELNVKPGPIVGKILNKLFEEVDEDLSKNNNEFLTNKIKELGKEFK